MALSARLEMRQGQQLVMTPQLQQAIRLLQLSNLELNAFVEQEVERNPLLERDESTEAALPTTIDSALDAASDQGLAAAADYAPLDLARPDADAAGALDTSAANLYPDASIGDIGPDLGGAHWSNVNSGAGFGGDDEIGRASCRERV